MSYFNIQDPVPEGYYLVKAPYISPTARAIKIEFQIAVNGTGNNPPKVGILIREKDKAALVAAIIKRNGRKDNKLGVDLED